MGFRHTLHSAKGVRFERPKMALLMPIQIDLKGFVNREGFLFSYITQGRFECAQEIFILYPYGLKK